MFAPYPKLLCSQRLKRIRHDHSTRAPDYSMAPWQTKTDWKGEMGAGNAMIARWTPFLGWIRYRARSEASLRKFQTGLVRVGCACAWQHE
ncbi:hypothetical protein SERLA73DRAFT_188460 [Serpula lacrymans var. lacrymans S7.3]|uniref:Uncharacterized protein n=1 Tax=Serpula lacrymans var. lacrymans (strain S7.3) TaxID=936435 RepID=F8QBD0_SERL3|nr:hypothetical protein SERLA73DRAFT_188460 [Serpula lacrymans var. lacrymans S7.3]